jgi:glucose/arabinose dehydrogenase
VLDENNLYISSGDGGGGNDADGGVGHHEPGGNAQWDQTLLGKMLRITVNPTLGTYTIPSNNPFFGSIDPLVKKEIWLLGLRNPYRDSFDRLTGRMFIGDVGQSTREEIDVQQPSNPGGGENYGWREREGLIQNPAYPTPAPTPTPSPPWVNPILDYPRSLPAPTPCNGVAGRTVVGGYVYRGKQIPALRGTYVFGDYLGASGCGAKIFTLNYDGTSASNAQDITAQLFPTIDTPAVNLVNPSSFGEDANGELYITDISNGSVYRIVPATANVQIDSVTRMATGHILVQGSGVPFKVHNIQASPDLIQPFVTIGTATAGGDGNFQFDDAAAPGFAKRFYRVTYP